MRFTGLKLSDKDRAKLRRRHTGGARMLEEESPLAVPAFKAALKSNSARVRLEAVRLYFAYVYGDPLAECPSER